MSIVITGASGQLGRLTAEVVLDRVPASEVILTTRRPEALSELAERGASVRQADFDRPETLAEAFAGGEKLLLISADDLGRRTSQHRAAIEAARDAGVRHVAYTSYLNPVEQNPAVITPSHRDTEWALRESGLAWTALRHAFYAEYQVPAGAQAIATGQLIHNNGYGKTAYVSREDCAAAAAAVLTTEGHKGRAYDITGPESFSQGDVAALLSEVSGGPRVCLIRESDPRGPHRSDFRRGREPYRSRTALAAAGVRSPSRRASAVGIRMSQHQGPTPAAPKLPATLRIRAGH